MDCQETLQFNLAEVHAGLEAAKWPNFKAAILYDNGANVAELGNVVNPTKMLAVESANKAVYWAM